MAQEGPHAFSGVLPTGPGHSHGIEMLRELNRRALDDPEEFWAPYANELLWYERGRRIFSTLPTPPYGEWFKGWTTNLSANCLDRWLSSATRNKIAYYWEGEPGDRRAITYHELHRETDQFAAVLRSMGVRETDRVTIYLPLIPEAIVAMLATVRLGAVHSVVFGGFTAAALAERMRDSGSKLLITADGGWRRGKIVALKAIADEALRSAPMVEHVIVVRRTRQPVDLQDGRDVWYHEALRDAPRGVPPAHVDSIRPSFILYTSGTTGRPKGAVHGTGGYLLWLYFTQKAVFDVAPRETYWCTADIGWITGHSYVVYGPLARGLTSVLYEGAPDFPRPDRWWEIIERYGVNILYTSPTAIRGFMKHGIEWPERHDLTSLRLLGSVGEPINPEAWHWYDRHIGRQQCPIVDTWWQTETGGIMISPQPGLGVIPLKPGSATFPMPGVDAAVVDDEGKAVLPGEKGYLVIRHPWPGQFTGLWRDPERYHASYFSRFSPFYFPADFCFEDRDGYFWLLGRADEVMKIAGHRLSTTEVEDALISHPAVAESAVIGRADELKGEVPVACVILRPDRHPAPSLRAELLERVREQIGPIAVPAELYFVEKLPKTRSAKIMRRLLRDVVEQRPLGDVTTLEDETSIEEARRVYDEFRKEIDRARQ